MGVTSAHIELATRTLQYLIELASSFLLVSRYCFAVTIACTLGHGFLFSAIRFIFLFSY